ncbi:EF-hand domain-containing member C2, partial [Nowakowskiella sp. JEL0078]
MVIHFYLSDDTLEIRESIPLNSGREHNTLFLRRCRLPKRPHVARVNGHVPNESADAYYSDSDFMIGSVLHLYGRPFVVCDCDDFTKQYYAEKYGLEEFNPVNLDDVTEEEEEFVKLTAKDDSQIGIPSSTLLPRKDFRKLIRYDGVVLRFSAILRSDKQVDRDRRFIVSFFVADDTIAVFEPHQRNSGIIGGKFLEKQWIKKKTSENFYGTQDFYI